MSAEKLLLKIKQDAEAEAASILAQAAERADAARAEMLKKAQSDAAQILRKAQADAEEIERRAELTYKLESRKHALQQKRAVIDEVFCEAERQLNTLSGPKWEELILHTVVRAALTGEEKLRVPAKDISAYQAGLLEKLNRQLASDGTRKGNLQLDTTASSVEGGVLLIGDTCDINASFHVLIRELREKLEAQVSDILFRAEVD